MVVRELFVHQTQDAAELSHSDFSAILLTASCDLEESLSEAHLYHVSVVSVTLDPRSQVCFD